MTLIRVPRPAPRVVELEDQGAFASVMEQSEQLRRNSVVRGKRQRVKVVIQVMMPGSSEWLDYAVFWEGYWGQPIAHPEREDLLEAARSTGARRAQEVIRSII